jgi:hypothetical protein
MYNSKVGFSAAKFNVDSNVSPKFSLKGTMERPFGLKKEVSTSFCNLDKPVVDQRAIVKKLTYEIRIFPLILTIIPEIIICGIRAIGIYPITFSLDFAKEESISPNKLETSIVNVIQKIISISFVI